ncbi:MAG TPA: adenylate/guanylate cyclase domain-containing protein [Syntrophomonadaceae bacterium]|nr:adenylate/guanylate cyclase domain-containing protein [Syntrophomonadaceae bacterium]
MVIILKKWSLITHISIFLLFALFIFVHFFETLDYRLQDTLYQKPATIDADIVIIGIDDDSLEALGRWPFHRDYHGELIRLISEGEPQLIAYDVIFAEESDLTEDDAYLVEMAAQAGNLIFPIYGTFSPSSGRGTLEAVNISKPFPALDEVSQAGHINTIIDNDGIIRKTILNFNYEKETINSFALEIYNQYAAQTGKEIIEISSIPTDEWERTNIRFSGEPKSFELIPFYQVLNGEVPGEYFRDKIVLVGPTAIGIADDYYFTPLAPQVPMYGVEIHANIIAQFIKGEFWQEVPFITQLIIMLLLALLGFFLFRKLRPSLGAISLLAIIGIFLLLSRMLSSANNGYIFSLIYPIGLLAVQYIAILGENFISEQLEKKRVTDVFGKYVAPQIVDKILEEGEAGLQLGGARRDITVLFVDIRGFTPLSEAAQPEEVVAILNDYLTLCAESIFAYGGTLDKYIGDAAMALYNAPLDLDNHQLKAVQTAMAMQKGSVALREKLEKQFGKTVHFGVGIHTGNAIVGNIGADFRMDYTAIGDTVNTAARIESVSKPGQILISQAVYEQVKEVVEVSDLGTIKVKGKAQELQIYQVNKLLI